MTVTSTIVVKTFRLSLIVALLIFTSSALGAKFAYIPILTKSGPVYVVNTSTFKVVTQIPAYNPTAVAINSDGSKVYVSQRHETEEGSIIIIDAHTNEVLTQRIENIGLVQPSSLIYHPNTNALYVTHNNGITKIELDSQGLPTGNTSILFAKYNSGEIDYVDDYIFTTGVVYNLNEPTDSGISIFDANTLTGEPIDELSLGNGGSIGITFNEQDGIIYVSNRSHDSISAIKYSVAGLSLVESYDVEGGYSPYGIAYDADYNRLYIANSATGGGFNDGVTSQEGGNLGIIDFELGVEAEYNKLDITDERYATYYSLHPMAVNYDRENSEIFVLKDLWLSVDAGIYLSVIRNRQTGLDISSEEHLHIHNGGKPQFSGRFIGPDCILCPSGTERGTTTITRRSGITLQFILLVLSLVAMSRYFGKAAKRFYS